METPLEMAERLLREASNDSELGYAESKNLVKIGIANALINLHYAQNGLVNPQRI